MKKLIILLAVVGLLSGCATYDKAVIWGFETFINDELKEEGS